MGLKSLATLLLLLLALPGRADVVDGGSLVVASQGVVGATMTVQGDAFSVGTSTFSISYGTVTVGGLLKVSSAGIQWADGKPSTTAFPAGAIPASTQTRIVSGTSWSNTSWNGCLGSTATFTTSGGPVHFYAAGTVNPVASWGVVSLWGLIDGSFLGSYTASKPYVNVTALASSGYYIDGAFEVLTSSFGAGTHSLCIGAATTAGTASFETDFSFGAFEVR